MKLDFNGKSDATFIIVRLIVINGHKMTLFLNFNPNYLLSYTSQPKAYFGRQNINKLPI